MSDQNSTSALNDVLEGIPKLFERALQREADTDDDQTGLEVVGMALSDFLKLCGTKEDSEVIKEVELEIKRNLSIVGTKICRVFLNALDNVTMSDPDSEAGFSDLVASLILQLLELDVGKDVAAKREIVEVILRFLKGQNDAGLLMEEQHDAGLDLLVSVLGLSESQTPASPGEDEMPTSSSVEMPESPSFIPKIVRRSLSIGYRQPTWKRTA
jgi:hypothetical protein